MTSLAATVSIGMPTHSLGPPIACNNDVIYKPEVHKVSQRRQRRTETRTAMGSMHRNLGSSDVYMWSRISTDRQTDIQTLVTIFRSPIGKHVTFAYCAVRTNFRRRQKWCCRTIIMSQTFSTSWYSFKNSVRNIDNWES